MTTPPISHLLETSLHVADLPRSRAFYQRVFELPHLGLHEIVIESRVIQSHGGTSLYVRNPDGHSLEVATPGLWPIH